MIHLLLALPLRAFCVALPLVRSPNWRTSFPFTTPYNQTSKPVERVISNAENANKLCPNQHSDTPTESTSNVPNPLRRVQKLEDGIWVEFVELIAPFDPKPIPKRDACAQPESGQERDCVRWGEEEQIDDEGD